MSEKETPEDQELLEANDKINLTENPLVFHYDKPSFPRNLLTNGALHQALSPEATKMNDLKDQENKPFIENELQSGGSSEDGTKVAFDIPEDRYHLCYIIMYILGFGTLLPWNFFITANDYFKKKLETRPDFQVSFQNYFSIAAMVPNVLMMLLNIFCLQRFNRVYRMGIALVCMIVIFTLTTILVILDTERWTGTFFGVTLASVVLINMNSAILQGGIFGFAGMLPPRYTQAVMGGQGLGGLFAAVASILSQLGQNNVIKSAFGYFFTATTVLAVCLVALIAIFRLEFVKYHTTASKYKCSCKCDSLVHDHLPEFINEDADEKMQVKIKKNSSKTSTPYFAVFRKIFPMAFSVTVAFFVTLACFPSITARILSVSKKKTPWTKFFVSVTCFLFFNLGDYVGRCLAGVVQIPKKRWPKWILPMICIARIAFIPLFIFCNAQPRTVPVFFNHDVFPVIFMLLFATTNGYFGSLAMMYGPSAVDGEHAELAGTIMACCISTGLGLGAASSFLVTSFI